MPRHTLLPALALLLLSSQALAGDINPPAGPVVATMKPLTDVEPRTAINAANTPGDADSVFRIAQPGSYFLTANVAGANAKSGIEIAASGVTLDLSGFTLAGGGLGTQAVVVVGSGLHSIAIVNGAASNWTLSAFDTFSATHCRLENLRAASTGGAGVRAGSQTIIRGCTATLNAGSGISAGSGCTIDHCAASANVAGGINTQGNCIVTDCTAESNSGGPGITVFTGSVVSHCAATSNTTGILSSGECTIDHCAARLNSSAGIFVGQNSTITQCAVGSNTQDGIRGSANCLILNNVCRANGLAAGSGSGINVNANGARVEGNVCTGNFEGIKANTIGNFFSRNTCSGNLINNWNVAAGNICLVVSAAAAPAVSGNSGGAAPGSTDPNANFTY